MKKTELRDWQKRLGISYNQAAKGLGICRRGYALLVSPNAENEKMIPHSVELASAVVEECGVDWLEHWKKRHVLVLTHGSGMSFIVHQDASQMILTPTQLGLESPVLERLQRQAIALMSM